MTKQIKCLVRLIGVCVLLNIMVSVCIEFFGELVSRGLLTQAELEIGYIIGLALVGLGLGALLGTFIRRRAPAASLPSSDPPQLAQYLLWYLPRNQREPVMGDLAEDFQRLVTHFGRRKAVVWYYAQVVMSFWPYLERALAKLLRWGVFGWIAEKFGRFIH